MRVTFTEVNGIETRYYHEGQGRPLMLVHGAGVSADSWLRNIDGLARDFRVIAPDTLGHGFTGRGAFNGGPPQPHMVRHLVGLADQLKLDRFAICGSSFGAMLSLLTYFEIKDRIERIVLVSSASSTLTDEERAKSSSAAFANGMSAMSDPSLDTVTRRIGRIFHDASKIPPEMLLMQLNIYSRPGVRENYELIMRGMMDFEASRAFRVSDRFHEIEAPLLLVWGLDDKRVIYSRAVEAAGRAREGYLVGIENCSHEPHIEHPERFNALVRQFLRNEGLDAYRVRKAD